MPPSMPWIDRAIGYIAPRTQLARAKARLALDFLASYDAASTGRRTHGWRRYSGDANASIAPSLSLLRDRARDLVRNNGHAVSALETIQNDVVGYGIVAAEGSERFRDWAESTDCDADGVNNLAGLQKLVVRTMHESGEALVRRRWRRPSDGLSLPMQLQVLEPDYLDSTRDLRIAPNGNRIIQGIEFDSIGRRVAYWMFREHPGSSLFVSVGTRFGESVRVPASEVAHVYDRLRPGQVRGVTSFAPVLMRIRDYDEYADATLMKQKVAALLTVFVTDVNGAAPRLGAENTDYPLWDSLEPGQISYLNPGEDPKVVDPPSVREYGDYSKVTLREIAAGLGVNYEDLTGDYTGMPFSAARMSRLRHWKRVNDWRWRILEPQLLKPVWRWAGQAAEFARDPLPARTEWTAPPLPMIEPDKEGLAIMRNVRAGIMTPSEAVRERGFNWERFIDEYQRDLAEMDGAGVEFDSDARKFSQTGQKHPGAEEPVSAPHDDDEPEGVE